MVDKQLLGWLWMEWYYEPGDKSWRDELDYETRELLAEWDWEEAFARVERQQEGAR